MNELNQQSKTFLQEISHSNYIVRDHRVYEIRMLPGVALLDMIYRLATVYLGSQAIELRKIVFKQPVVTSDLFDKNVFVTFTPRQSHWQVTVSSQKVKDNAIIGAELDENMECLLYLTGDVQSTQTLDVKSFIANATKRWDMDDVYQLARTVHINHFVFMKTLGMIYQRGHEELMELRLSQLAEKYRFKFYGHPAFLDGSTLAGSSFRLCDLQSEGLANRPYIPFMIERFCIYQPFPPTIYTYSKNMAVNPDNPGSLPDITVTDITIFNEAGQVLAQFEKLTGKRIREPYLVKELVEIPAASKASPPAMEKPPKNESDDETAQNNLTHGDFNDDLVSYLQKEIGRVLRKHPDEIDPDLGFYGLGLDSSQLLGLVKVLEGKLSQELYPTLLFEYSNIRRLAEYFLENSISGLPDFNQPFKDSREDDTIIPADSDPKIFFWEPVWRRQDIAQSQPAHGWDFAAQYHHLILLDERWAAMQPLIQDHFDHADVIMLDSDGEHCPDRAENQVKQLWEMIQKNLRQTSPVEMLVQVVADADQKGNYIYTLGGLLKSAYMENPKIQSRIITVDQFQTQSPEDIIRILGDEVYSREKGSLEIKYTGQPLQRHVRKLLDIDLSPVKSTPYCKENGVYVITGGLGGLGLLIAAHMAGQAKIKLALIGRSKVTKRKACQINELIQRGAEVLYLKADLGKKADAAKAFKTINDTFGPIHGIFHNAGVLKDQFIIQKDIAEISETFHPKAQGLWNLDEITADEKLDFLVVFSSISAVMGNLGQADYAAANAFMDIFAEARRDKVKQGIRHGKTIAINWPLWAEGGMQAGSELEQMMKASWGMKALPSKEGLEALDRILNQDNPRVIVLYGAENKICAYIGPYMVSPETAGITDVKTPLYVDMIPKVKNNSGQRLDSSDDIAIIGLSGRYPLADTMDQFCQNLRTGRDCITGFPKERWRNYQFSYDVEEFYRYGGFVDPIDEFDPLFFNIAPWQAERMDPQARQFLQIAWQACEDAGFCPDKLVHHYPPNAEKSVGVFAGVFWNHYELFGAEISQRGKPLSLGITPASIPNMVSYCMNFHGPSIAVDTMCSSSLTAIHLACESIRNGECGYAIAGGVNLATHPHKYMFLKQSEFLASDGRCRSFGEGGDGYVPGEGVGAVLLTSLQRAEKEGYHIYGVIKGSALNHGGKAAGITVPDPVAQSEVIAAAIEKAGIDPRTISYIEAHGTGTSLGDPIEIQGLTRAFTRWTQEKQYCALGSLKSNIGHLEAAAGIAGITKLLLQLKCREIFPSLHAERLNPYIPFQNTPFFLQQQRGEWHQPTTQINGETLIHPRRAGISAFGANGSNAHIIIEEYISKDVPGRFGHGATGIPKTSLVIVPLSAQNENALMVYAQNLLDFLEKEKPENPGDIDLGDLAYTLQIGREAMRYRVAFVVRNLPGLAQNLQLYTQGQAEVDNCFQGSAKKDPELITKLTVDEDLNEAVTQWIRKEKVNQLAELWVKGLHIDWNLLYGERKPRRISLPTYPFAKEHYWIPEMKTLAGSNTTAPLVSAFGRGRVRVKGVSFRAPGGEPEVRENTMTVYPEHFDIHIQSFQPLIPQPDPSTQAAAWEIDQKLAAMNELLVRLLWDQLRSLGWFDKDWTDTAKIKAASGLPAIYGRWLDESLTVLMEHNCLQINDGQCTVLDTTPVDMERLWLEWERFKEPEEPHIKAQMKLAAVMIRALPDILTGRTRATDIMFPNSSMELVARIYQENPVADYFNDRLADSVAAYMEARLKQDARAGIRLIEIGAGTGGTSVAIFRKLATYREHILEYCYTDISKAFLIRAETEYGPEYPYLTYKIFNAEAPVAGQDVRAGGYDLVIAANVLHATQNIRQTLRNVKALLPKNGVILFNEISRHSLFTHLTFGLLEGWWRYGDAELRLPGGPGLAPPAWRNALENEGFQSVFFPAEPAHDLGQQIIIAESDGVIRQLPILERKVTFLDPVPETGGKSGAGAAGQIIRDWVGEVITGKLVAALKVDVKAVEMDRAFAEYGVDSIIGVNLVQEINRQLGIELQTTDLFDYPSVNQLTRNILAKYRDRLAKAMREDVSPERNPWVLSPVPADDGPRKLPGLISPKRFAGTRRPALKKSGAYTKAAISREPIAIIGMSGRFAKSSNVAELWEHLAGGHDLVETVTRWDLARYYPDQTNYCNSGSFLDDIDRFDALFFNISGLEAIYMDPQQRIFLEESWKALEDAGYVGKSIGGRCLGVYVGSSVGDYKSLVGDEAPPQALWGYLGAVVPARIAYYLDLQGPAVSIDTACSSSLVAIHMACQGLWDGETEMALAGGIYIHTTPQYYLAANKAGMLSPTGHCHTFDDRADGMVPGEAAGVVVLKRLQEAIADGDHIYGVIRGSGINQDGATNGITAPSATSQERLECNVYDTFGIDPGQIQMVEAHGTATKLGDPVEFRALTKAFRHYTAKQEFCAIGSIKTNLGHTQLAAGITGVIKTLLSLQHKQIPPSLHFQTGNSHIEFADSPFYVNTHLKEWEVDPGVKRCAVVSAFGAGGTNAHIVIEESPVMERRHPEKPGYLMVLSARTLEQLRRQARQMAEYCGRENGTDCGNMSYTLLVGRRHFNHRLACIVHSPSELAGLLEKWLEKGKVTAVYQDEIRDKDHRENSALLRYGNQCIQNCRKAGDPEYLEHLAMIAELYIQGYDLEYEELFAGEAYSRVSLPTYPFAGERYWAPVTGAKSAFHGMAGVSTNAFLHPLLHQNTSDFHEQRFSSTFTGREFFLADHVIKGRRVLSGVAQIEMARAAIVQAAGDGEQDQSGITLKNIVWIRPVTVVDKPIQVHIGLYPEDDGKISYQIYSIPPLLAAVDQTGPEPVVHSQGTAWLHSVSTISQLDLAALQSECCQGILSSIQYYEAYQAMGIDYGPGHKGIERVYLGTDQVLAKLAIPKSVADTSHQYFLHPGLLDSAVQASLGLVVFSGDLKPFLPFALDELEILGRCTPDMWAWVRPSTGDKIGESSVLKLDIDLSDGQGKVLIRLKGFSARELDAEVVSAGQEATTGTLMLESCWLEQALTGEYTERAVTNDYAEQLAIFCEPEEGFLKIIESATIGSNNTYRRLVLQSGEQSVDQRFRTYTGQILGEIQRIFREKPQEKVLVQIVVSLRDERQVLAGLGGILKTACLENSRFIGQLIEIDIEDCSQLRPSIEQILAENGHSPTDRHIRYQDGKRWVAGWSEIKAAQGAAGIPWKDGCIYLITGGAGGLGFIFAQEIARQVREATIILVGRSPLDTSRQTAIKQLEALGAQAEYRQTDVANKQAVVDLMQTIQESYGGIHGIIHGAGIIRDSYIHKKTAQEWDEVLAPKVSGLVNLDEATRDLPLDFLVSFSSLSGAMGNPGQADYAAANAFMDAYAGYRNTLVALQQRHGHTLSINWPLWQEGGMHVDSETETLMIQSTGMRTLRTSTGIGALYQSMALAKDRVLIMEGQPAKMRQKMLPPPIPATVKAAVLSVPAPVAAESGLSGLPAKIRTNLIPMISQILKLNPEDIDGNVELNKYGFDSITLTEFTNKLNREFKLELAPTIFFEYPTLHGFTEYLAREHRSVLETRWKVPIKTVAAATVWEDDTKPGLTGKRRFSRWAENLAGTRPKIAQNTVEPIAIVGISGVFPMARDVHEFRKNLAEGKDCISEIPPERWNWRDYYGNPAMEANKTNIKWGGFIEGAAKFDPLFFGISPKEAEYMDPQQRLLMTYVWQAMEDAGISAESLSGTKTAIIVGTGSSGYGGLLTQANIPIEGYTSTGNVPSVGPNRMSYFLNIHGPSEPVETACSSSLIAIHRAVSAIESGNCEMAIAGGINLILTPDLHISFSKAGMLCEDGRCKTFSDTANGYARGEGAGMLFLKKLKDAERAGDHIYGVIIGSAENHGGRANSLTAPNPKAQAELLVSAYTKAGIDPRTVTYIETHGTGTELGDPVEINGLKAAFQELYQATGEPMVTGAYCGLGSVKSNIGHLELAAGVAGVIKILLQLQTKTLFKSLHCDTINPYIKLQDSPFYIVQEAREWKSLQDADGRDIPRRTGISSFGFGGANAHLVIEEYIPKDRGQSRLVHTPQNPALIVLSAKNEERLKERAGQLLALLEDGQPDGFDLADMAYTLQVGREPMEERLGFIVGSISELAEKLRAFLEGREGVADLYRGQVKRNKETLAIFEMDEDLQQSVDLWIAKGKYGNLLELWVKGLAIDWNKFYPRIKPQKISLPAYPFAKDYYWIPSHEENQPVAAPSRKRDRPFDEQFFGKLMDEILNDQTSVDVAATKTRNNLLKAANLKY